MAETENDHRELERALHGALVHSIDDHGSITKANRTSAVKRIVGALKTLEHNATRASALSSVVRLVYLGELEDTGNRRVKQYMAVWWCPLWHTFFADLIATTKSMFPNIKFRTVHAYQVSREYVDGARLRGKWLFTDGALLAEFLETLYDSLHPHVLEGG